MPQGIARRLIITPQEVHIENVLPWPPAHGPRLDLAQADVPQRKHAERLEQSPRRILDLKRDRCFVRAGWYQATVISAQFRVRTLVRYPCRPSCGILTSRTLAQSSNQKKSREVPLVVLNAGLQDLS